MARRGRSLVAVVAVALAGSVIAVRRQRRVHRSQLPENWLHEVGAKATANEGRIEPEPTGEGVAFSIAVAEPPAWLTDEPATVALREPEPVAEPEPEPEPEPAPIETIEDIRARLAARGLVRPAA